MLVAILYHAQFEEEMARIVRPYYKRASVHWCLVLLEFVLCELRKGNSSGARIYREPTSSMIKKYAGRTKLPAWARKAQAPGTQQKSRQTLGAKGSQKPSTKSRRTQQHRQSDYLYGAEGPRSER